MAISRQKEARSRNFALLLFRMTSRVLYSAQYHRLHYTLQAFEHFGTLYMHNHDDRYPPARDSNLVPPVYKSQSIRVSHQSRPARWRCLSVTAMLKVPGKKDPAIHSPDFYGLGLSTGRQAGAPSCTGLSFHSVFIRDPAVRGLSTSP